MGCRDKIKHVKGKRSYRATWIQFLCFHHVPRLAGSGGKSDDEEGKVCEVRRNEEETMDSE